MCISINYDSSMTCVLWNVFGKKWILIGIPHDADTRRWQMVLGDWTMTCPWGEGEEEEEEEGEGEEGEEGEATAAVERGGTPRDTRPVGVPRPSLPPAP